MNCTIKIDLFFLLFFAMSSETLSINGKTMDEVKTLSYLDFVVWYVHCLRSKEHVQQLDIWMEDRTFVELFTAQMIQFKYETDRAQKVIENVQ